MGRTVIIGTLMVFAIFNLLLGLGFYLFLKKRKENGQSLYETPVNQQTRTEKLGLGEILVYLSLIAIAGIFAFQTLNRGGVGNSILACRWIEKHHSVPPILFDDLVKELLPDEMKEHVSRLLDIKLKGPEGMEIEPIEPIQDFIIKNIQELDDYVQSVTEEKKDWKALNQFFLEELSRD